MSGPSPEGADTLAAQLTLRLLRGQGLLSPDGLHALLCAPEPLNLTFPGSELLEEARQAHAALKRSAAPEALKRSAAPEGSAEWNQDWSGAQTRAQQTSAALLRQARALGHPAQLLPDAEGLLGLPLLLATTHLALQGRAVNALHARLLSLHEEPACTPERRARQQEIAAHMRQWARLSENELWQEEFLHLLELDRADDLSGMWLRAHEVVSGSLISGTHFSPEQDAWEHLRLMSRRDQDVRLFTLRSLGLTRYENGVRVSSHTFWREGHMEPLASQMSDLWAEHTDLWGDPHAVDWGEEPLVTAGQALRLPFTASTVTGDPQTLFVLAWAGDHARNAAQRPLSQASHAAFPHATPQAQLGLLRRLSRETLHPGLRAALKRVAHILEER